MSEQYVSIAEVNELLTAEAEKRREKEIEFNPIQKSALEHAQKNAVLSKESADALMAEINGLSFDINGEKYQIPGYLVCKITDVLPKYPNDVRAIFYKERIDIAGLGIDTAVIDIVSKYI